ncbi:MAG: hypothetical protein ACJ8H8_09825 [Geminicoccaceae bacterium]
MALDQIELLVAHQQGELPASAKSVIIVLPCARTLFLDQQDRMRKAA